METVIVNISRSGVMSDMRVKSHAEVASIADPTERYLAEAGTEKTEELNQCITDATAEATAALRTFMTGFGDALTADDYYDTTEDITFALSVTERKAAGLSEALAKAIHAYIVESALDKFYTSVARPELAQRHAARLATALSVIDNLIYRRSQPTYSL